MEKLSEMKVKHNHTLTDIIKVSIFALFLILPILVFLPNCLYYGFNEHATNETTTQINYKYQSNVVNTKDDLIIGNIYHFNFNGGGDEFFYNECVFELLKVYQYNLTNCNPGVDYETWSSILENTPIEITFESYGPDLLGGLSIELNQDENLVYYNLDLDHSLLLNAEIRLKHIDKTYIDEQYIGTYFTISDYNIIESITENIEQTITQSITNAWQRIWETPMLNWTNTNTFNFTINTFSNVFGITQESKINNYLTYILTLTCIYLIFDVVITLTTKLTHLINAK